MCGASGGGWGADVQRRGVGEQRHGQRGASSQRGGVSLSHGTEKRGNKPPAVEKVTEGNGGYTGRLGSKVWVW